MVVLANSKNHQTRTGLMKSQAWIFHNQKPSSLSTKSIQSWLSREIKTLREIAGE